MSPSGPHLSLADLTAHDPHARSWSPGRRARFCCPLPECQGKKIDAAHRTLTVYPEGGWTCARCKARGKLVDAWEERSPERPTRRDASGPSRAVVRTRPVAPPDDGPYDLAAELRAVVPIAGTSAAVYLESRGIPERLAHASGVRFAPAFGSSVTFTRQDGTMGNAKGGPAAVFPLRDEHGRIAGAQGRYTLPGGFWKEGPNKLTQRARGALEMGAFATPGAFEARTIVLLEAPIDALSLHACGVPAIATVGTTCPVWLLEALSLSRVALAHDADEAGDKAARTIADELALGGAFCERLRPPEGCKDWNDALKRLGVDHLGRALRACMLPPASPLANKGGRSQDSLFAMSPDKDPYEDPD